MTTIPPTFNKPNTLTPQKYKKKHTLPHQYTKPQTPIPQKSLALLQIQQNLKTITPKQFIPNIQTLIHACKQNTREQKTYPNPIKEPIVQTLNKLIITPLDKNPGHLYFECPQLYHYRLTKLFHDDKEHFQHINKTTSPPINIINNIYTEFIEILAENKTTQKHNLHLIDKTTNHTLPTAYVTPKDKDTSRSRPINPHYNHILNKTFTAVARCIDHILLKIATKIPTLEIKEINTLKPNIAKINQHIKTHFLNQNHSCNYNSYKGDIKNMYTELPHDNIIQAITWACSTYNNISRTRSPIIHVSTTKTPEQPPSTTHFPNNNTATFTLLQIIKIVKLSLKTAYFTIGNQIIYKQILGIPMGSPLSSALANALCTYYEQTLTMKAQCKVNCTLCKQKRPKLPLKNNTFIYL